MKSRSSALVDKSIGAMVSAIEVYNKPSFKYREETFAVLAINAWELLLKAKWLDENNNAIKSLYVMEPKQKANGEPSKVLAPRTNRSGNSLTHSMQYIAEKLLTAKHLTGAACANLELLVEIRDSAVHFYNQSPEFAQTLQAVGCAAVKNFVFACENWFDITLAEFNFCLMPIAFVAPQGTIEGIPLNRSEMRLATYIAHLDDTVDKKGDFNITVTVNVKFDRSGDVDALKVRLSNDPDATPIHLSDAQLRDRFPYVYRTLTKACIERYSDFQVSPKYHALRAPLKKDPKYCHLRSLDPGNTRSPKTEWFSKAVFSVLDSHYTLRVAQDGKKLEATKG